MKTTTIPILDLKPELEFLWKDLMDAVEDVFRSGQFIMGENVKAFEDEVAKYLGTEFAIAVNSGTDALVIALDCLGIGLGDEVITTPFTFFATAEAISRVGATPVFIDVEPTTFNLDPHRIEEAITSRTKAILPVHLYGHPCDMDRIMEIAGDYNLFVVEDCAQSFGAMYKDKRVGSIGHVGCYSFFPSKNLGAYGDGGLLALSNTSMVDAARKLRSHGSRKKYYNEVIGYNSRLDEIQAAILRVKLPFVEKWNDQRRNIASNYSSQLSEVPNVVCPVEVGGVRHVYHQYTIRTVSDVRDSLRTALDKTGITTMVYYPTPLHLLPMYYNSNRVLPIAEKLSREVLSLPMWPSLRSDQQLQVVDELSKILTRL